MTMYFGLPVGLQNSTSDFSGKPDHGTIIDQVSTQRWR